MGKLVFEYEVVSDADLRMRAMPTRQAAKVFVRPGVLRLRGGRSAGATATPMFDATLAELLEYLRWTSNNVSVTAASNPAGHVGQGQERGGEEREKGALASFIESELEEEEPNYNRCIPVCIYLFSFL